MTANLDLNDGHLAGNVLLVSTAALPVTLTIPDTLRGKEPVTVIQAGAGSITVAAGGTTALFAPGGGLTTNQQYAGFVIIPDVNNADTYWVMGDLS